MTDPTVEQSILQSVKKLSGLGADYDAFDIDIIIHINSFISALYQMGIGLTDTQFEVVDGTETWEDLLTTQKNVAMVKSYMALKLRQIFDPANTGFTTDSFDRQIAELEARIVIAVETT